jgi:hypothetical protein
MYKNMSAGPQWLTLVILAIWEAEIRKIMVQGQPMEIVQEIPSPKITRAKWTVGVTQMVERLFARSNSSPTYKKRKHAI